MQHVYFDISFTEYQGRYYVRDIAWVTSDESLTILGTGHIELDIPTHINPLEYPSFVQASKQVLTAIFDALHLKTWYVFGGINDLASLQTTFELFELTPPKPHHMFDIKCQYKTNGSLMDLISAHLYQTQTYIPYVTAGMFGTTSTRGLRWHDSRYDACATYMLHKHARIIGLPDVRLPEYYRNNPQPVIVDNTPEEVAKSIEKEVEAQEQVLPTAHIKHSHDYSVVKRQLTLQSKHLHEHRKKFANVTNATSFSKEALFALNAFIVAHYGVSVSMTYNSLYHVLAALFPIGGADAKIKVTNEFVNKIVTMNGTTMRRINENTIQFSS